MAKCKYCGKTFYKKHNRQVYCPNCRDFAYQDSKAKANREYRKRKKDGGFISTVLGSKGTSLGGHRNSNFHVEFMLVEKQLRALNLK